MTYTRADLERKMNALPFKGFTVRSDDQDFIWQQRTGNHINQILIGYRTYPTCFYLHTPCTSIIFPEVEDPLNALYDKYKVKFRNGNSTIETYLDKVDTVDYEAFDTAIQSDDDFDILGTELEKFFHEGALRYFRNFSDLKRVVDQIDRLNPDDAEAFVCGNAGIKIPLMKKIIRSPDFVRELRQWHRFYSAEVFNYPKYVNHDKVFQELFAEDLRVIGV